MSASNLSPPATPEKTGLEAPELTEAQVKFLDDLRISLTEMQQGKVRPAREIEREISESQT